MKLPAYLLLLGLGSALGSGPLPSCEDDVVANCLGEDADMSPEGITACLKGLASPSNPCVAYLALVEGCTSDLAAGGICASDHAEGDTVACLIQRNKPDALSEACQAALPAQAEATGLKETFWKDGKRFLEDDEADKLGTEDTEMYERWVARKSKSAGSQKNRDRKYAIEKMKRGKLSKQLVASATEVAFAAMQEKKPKKAVKKLVKKEVNTKTKDAAAADKTMGFFREEEIAEIVDEALNDAKKQWKKAQKAEL